MILSTSIILTFECESEVFALVLFFFAELCALASLREMPLSKVKEIHAKTQSRKANAKSSSRCEF